MQFLIHRPVRFFLLSLFGAFACGVCASCSVQMAMKNRNTDCGFTNDNVNPNGRKDPMIFYGNPKSYDK